MFWTYWISYRYNHFNLHAWDVNRLFWLRDKEVRVRTRRKIYSRFTDRRNVFIWKLFNKIKKSHSLLSTKVQNRALIIWLNRLFHVFHRLPQTGVIILFSEHFDCKRLLYKLFFTFWRYWSKFWCIIRMYARSFHTDLPRVILKMTMQINENPFELMTSEPFGDLWVLSTEEWSCSFKILAEHLEKKCPPCFTF